MKARNAAARTNPTRRSQSQSLEGSEEGEVGACDDTVEGRDPVDAVHEVGDIDVGGDDQGERPGEPPRRARQGTDRRPEQQRRGQLQTKARSHAQSPDVLDQADRGDQETCSQDHHREGRSRIGEKQQQDRHQDARRRCETCSSQRGLGVRRPLVRDIDYPQSPQDRQPGQRGDDRDDQCGSSGQPRAHRRAGARVNRSCGTAHPRRPTPAALEPLTGGVAGVPPSDAGHARAGEASGPMSEATPTGCTFATSRSASGKLP